MRLRKKHLLLLPLIAVVLTGCYARPTTPGDVTGTSAVLRTSPAECQAGDKVSWWWRYRQYDPVQLDGIHYLGTAHPWITTAKQSYTCTSDLNNLQLNTPISGLSPGTYYQYQLAGTCQNSGPGTECSYLGSTFLPVGGNGAPVCMDDEGSLSDCNGDPGLPRGQFNNGDYDGTPGNTFRTQPWISCKDDYGQRAPAPGNIDMNNDGYCEPPGTIVPGAPGVSFYVGFDSPNTPSYDDRTWCHISRGGTDGSIVGFVTCGQNWIDPNGSDGDPIDGVPPTEGPYTYTDGAAKPSMAYEAKTQGYGAGACATGIAKWTAHNNKPGTDDKLFGVQMNQKICLTGGGDYKANTDPVIFPTIYPVGGTTGWHYDCSGSAACGGGTKINLTFPGGGKTSTTKRIFSFTRCPTFPTAGLVCIKTIKFPMRNYWLGEPGFIAVWSYPNR